MSNASFVESDPDTVDAQASDTTPSQLSEPENSTPAAGSQVDDGVTGTSSPTHSGSPPQRDNRQPISISTDQSPDQQHSPLTAENVAKLDKLQVAQSTYPFEHDVRHLATPHERLTQARIFLSDEDYWCCREFEDHWKEIDNFLRRLADDKIRVNLNLYNEFQDMLWIHKLRMDKFKIPEPSLLRLEPLRSSSALRLSSDHAAARKEAEIAFRREDHPPFSIEPKPQQREFLRAFRANTSEGKDLRNWESKIYLAALRNPKRVKFTDAENTFKARAIQRGGQRAAIQTALRALATSAEQHHKGDWLNRVITLPPPLVPETPEPEMFLALPENDRPASPDPFKYTQKSLQFQEKRRSAGLLEQQYGSILTRGILKHRCQMRLKKLVELWSVVIFGVVCRNQDGDPKFHQAQVRSYVSALQACDPVDPNCLTFEEKLAVVQMVARDYWDSDPLGEERVGDSVEAVNEMDETVLIDFHNSEGKIPGADVLRVIDKLAREIKQVLSQIENEDFEQTLRSSPKDAKQTPKRCRKDAHTNLEYNSKLIEIAQPLASQPLPSDPDEAKREALTLIRDKVLLETHLHHFPRNLDHEEAWSFVTDMPESLRKRNYFYLDRWTDRKQPPRGPDPPNEPLYISSSSDDNPDSPDGLPQSEDNDLEAGRSNHSSQPNKRRRINHAVPYDSLNPAATGPSYRLPPEQIGLYLVREDYGPLQQQDSLEHAMPLPIVTTDRLREDQTQRFNLPEPAADIDMQALLSTPSLNTTPSTSTTKKRNHSTFTSNTLMPDPVSTNLSLPTTPSSPIPSPAAPPPSNIKPRNRSDPSSSSDEGGEGVIANRHRDVSTPSTPTIPYWGRNTDWQTTMVRAQDSPSAKTFLRAQRQQRSGQYRQEVPWVRA